MLKIIFSTFFLVFLAELGDKTQITTMMLASESKSKTAVFIGSASALICSSLLGVLAGTLINKYIPESIIKMSSGAAFIIIGILFLLNKI
jgi:putative Ca2+/H+ antiporter (TMEM165/GDT1 family)